MVPWVNYWKKLKAGMKMLDDTRKGGVGAFAKSLAKLIAKNAHGIIQDTGKLSGNLATIIENASKAGDWLFKCPTVYLTGLLIYPRSGTKLCQRFSSCSVA